MKILAVGAHPDDLEFGMGGTLIKLIEEDHTAVGLVLTKGEMGTRGNQNERENEVRNAAKIVGYVLELLNLGDTKIKDDNETRLLIADIIRKHKPDIIFAPYHTNIYSHKDGAAHFDHTTTGQLVRNALRLAKFTKIETEHEAHNVTNLIYYMCPKGKVPTFVCDISKHENKMLEAVKVHKSQLTEEILDRLIIMRRYYGLMIGVKYGEPFIIDDPLKFDIDLFHP